MKEKKDAIEKQNIHFIRLFYVFICMICINDEKYFLYYNVFSKLKTQKFIFRKPDRSISLSSQQYQPLHVKSINKMQTHYAINIFGMFLVFISLFVHSYRLPLPRCCCHWLTQICCFFFFYYFFLLLMKFLCIIIHDCVYHLIFFFLFHTLFHLFKYFCCLLSALKLMVLSQSLNRNDVNSNVAI